MKSLREQIAELEDPAPKDFDPESLDTYHDGQSDSDDHLRDRAQGEFDGREHYENVGPSRLKKPAELKLGKRYEGSRVRRQDILGGNGDEHLNGTNEEGVDNAEEVPFAPVEEGSDEDPFAHDSSIGSEVTSGDGGDSQRRKKMRIVTGLVPEQEDEEIDSDEAFGEGDDRRFQKFKFLGSSRRRNKPGQNLEDEAISDESIEPMNGTGLPESEDGSEGGSQNSFEDESDEDIDMMDETETDASSAVDDNSPPATKAGKQLVVHGDRAALKALLSSDTAALASSLSAAQSADAKKGRAVRTQHQTFDRLLDARIKLQKGLAAANSMTAVQNLSEHEDAIANAKEAALKLWNTISSIRHSIAEAHSDNVEPKNTKKRKRPQPATTSTSISTLWSQTQSLSTNALPHHRSILNKWSAKIRASNPTTLAMESRSRLLLLLNNNNTQDQNSITNILDAYLTTETSKLTAQSTNPSNPPSSSTTPPSRLRYDDTPFYQSLLRDLISSRSSILLSSSNVPTLPTKLHPSKPAGKVVDTRASKGRKIRYTVHEKLQNFMAAEGWDGGTTDTSWREEARREFFASLMGGKGVLDEGDELESAGDGDGDGDVAVDGLEGDGGGLRLF